MTHTTSPAAWGVDGCKAGWFWFKLTGRWPDIAVADCDVARTDKDGRSGMNHIVERATAGDLILVDIPIGLPERSGRQAVLRACDADARKMVKPRWQSVFPVPVRPVLETLRGEKDWQRAREILSSAHTVPEKDTGRLQVQTFYLLDKIREVDDLLQASPKARRLVRETHPEVCFRAFHRDQGKPMLSSKKKREGKEERRNVLTELWPGSMAALRDARAKAHADGLNSRDVAEDDMLDAMACALTAALILEDKSRLQKLSGNPGTDEKGLPMEIVYAEPAP